MQCNTQRSAGELSRILEMAWEDRTPFEAIQDQFGLGPNELVGLMRAELKPGAFRLWRRRMRGRLTKHRKLRPEGLWRAYCPSQYKR